MRKIYIFTTESDRTKGRYKFGQTERKTQERVKNQQTGNSEKLEIITSVETDFSDHFIHNELEKLGYSKVNKGGDEWFHKFSSDDEAIALLYKIITKSHSVNLPIYLPRFYQSHIKKLFLDLLLKDKSDKKEFALELAPRFGKTLWALDLMIDLNQKGYKICLIPAYVLTAISSFEKEFYSFKNFAENMVFVNEHENYEEILQSNYGKKLIIIPVSLHTPDYQSKYNKINQIPSKEKFAIIDEADFGCHRNNSQEYINFLNSGLNIFMTGTAIERVINPLENVGDNIIRWSYTDMLMVKTGEHPIQKQMTKAELKSSMDSVKNIINPRFFRLSLGGVIDKFNSIPDQYKTDWNKLLMNVDKSKGVLIQLIKALHGLYNGTETSLIDIDTSEYSPKNVTHVFGSFPNKQQMNKFVNLYSEALGHGYIVQGINGDETSNREAEELAKKTIAKAKREGKNVVFISKDMASRSFSVSEIDTVILMFDRGQYSSISQKIARVLTPGKTFNEQDKVYGNIISLSLDPNREDISPIDEYLVYESEKVKVDELSDGIKRVLRSVNLFMNQDDLLQPIEIDKYSEKLINSTTLIKLGVESVRVDKVIHDTDLVKILTGVEVSNIPEVDSKVEGIDSSKVIRTENTDNNTKKVDEKKIDEVHVKLKEVLSNIVENVVEISEINNCESDDIIQTLRMIRKKGYDEEVIFEVGVDLKTVEKVIESGALSSRLLNTIITSYNKEENSLYLQHES